MLLKFFLNSSTSSYLRGLESEFDESTNAIRLELNRFEKAGLLTSGKKGNKKMFRANTEHPLFSDIHNLLMKHIGFDHIVEKVINKLGDVKMVFILGDFARGMDSRIIDLLFIGNDIDKEYLVRQVDRAEKMIKRRIRFLVAGESDYLDLLKENKKSEILLLWKE